MRRCHICKRWMVSWRAPWRWIAGDRMDCGGDCLRCIEEAEGR